MAVAEKLVIKMGSVVFDLSDEARDPLRVLAKGLKE